MKALTKSINKFNTVFLSGNHSLNSFLGTDNNKMIDKIVAILLSLTPILQNYKGIISLSATILMIIFPYMIYKIFNKIFVQKKINFSLLLVISSLILFNAYKALIHGISIVALGNAGLLCTFFLALALGCLNLKYFFKAIVAVGIIASVLIFIQYFCFYILGFHLQLAPTSLLLESSKQWIGSAQTGLIAITGRPNAFYRPAAFFLEPSHMFLYLFPCIMFLSLQKKVVKLNIFLSIIISFGILYTTSGMGIMFLIGNWGLFVLQIFYYKRKPDFSSLKKKSNIAITSLIVILLTSFLITGTLFQMVGRIYDGEAINGRTEQSDGLIDDSYNTNNDNNDTVIDNEHTNSQSPIIKKLSNSQSPIIKKLFGNPRTTDGVKFHLSAYASLLLNFGIIGLILGLIFYFTTMFKLRTPYSWLSFVLIGLTYFTIHTHGTFYMLFYVMIIYNVYAQTKKNIKNNSIKLRGSNEQKY